MMSACVPSTRPGRRRGVASPLRRSEHPQMAWIPGLNRAHQQVKLRQPMQVLETTVVPEKWPAGESAAHAALEPLKSGLAISCKREDAGDLIIGMMRVPERFRTCTRPGHAVQRLV